MMLALMSYENSKFLSAGGRRLRHRCAILSYKPMAHAECSEQLMIAVVSRSGWGRADMHPSRTAPPTSMP